MDIEQLKLILETLNAASADAQNLVLLYFGFELLRFVLGLSLLAGTVVTLYKIVLFVNRKDTFEADVMAALNISTYMGRAEKRRAIRWMVAGKAADITS